jgi:aminoglycoside 6-adenylyltransferase
MKINRRSEDTMMQLILDVARKDDRIRTVILNGSRASPSAKADIFQDYDIVYGVPDVEAFVNDPHWHQQFGEILILQKHDEMDSKWPSDNKKFTYLMQFTDWNRIDLTLLHLDKMTRMHWDSHSILLLDKDNLMGEFETPSDRDYLPKPPTLTDFQNACNEFLWVSTYVAKGLWRQELPYAKYTCEQIVKEELIQLLTWHAAIRTNYKKTIGKSGKYLCHGYMICLK